ncbi:MULTISPECIES: acyl carrier protein [unclassified Mesorhizobium]|uniref:acyl carrier protein n=1 Tax=unclassified Mesorhizobium TaxID=325217 RepID=UPI002479D2B9|nr:MULTISPECIES: acyl carrier protein [unclassified Mesorhizobium]
MNVQQRVGPVAVPGDGPAHAIAGIFATELGVPAVGFDDNFFDLGGDSLMAETLALAVQKRFGVKLQTSVLLEAQTPREFGRLIASLVPEHPARELIVPVSGSVGQEPIAMIHGITGSALFANRFSRRLKDKYASGTTGDPEAYTQSHEALARRIAARRGVVEGTAKRFLTPMALSYSAMRHQVLGYLLYGAILAAMKGMARNGRKIATNISTPCRTRMAF